MLPACPFKSLSACPTRSSRSLMPSWPPGRHPVEHRWSRQPCAGNFASTSMPVRPNCLPHFRRTMISMPCTTGLHATGRRSIDATDIPGAAGKDTSRSPAHSGTPRSCPDECHSRTDHEPHTRDRYRGCRRPAERNRDEQRHQLRQHHHNFTKRSGPSDRIYHPRARTSTCCGHQPCVRLSSRALITLTNGLRTPLAGVAPGSTGT